MTCYIRPYFKTKKALKEAVAEGRNIHPYSVSIFGNDLPADGKGIPIVGPGPYERKWYGQVDLVDGVIVKVK